MKVTMKDIANKLNISINAVSIALNDKKGVSDEMRLKILITADALGYINYKRRYLSVFSRTQICVMMQSYYAATGHFYSIVLESIHGESRQQGYLTTLNYFDDDHFIIPECIQERKVAGIIVVGKISDENLKCLNDMIVPIVLVDYTSLCQPFDCVLTHNRQGGYMMTHALYEKGYRKIGFFGDLAYSLSFQDRFLGYRESLLNNGIVNYNDVDEYIERYSFLKEIENFILTHQQDKIEALLKHKELPDVLVCANDSNADIVIKSLKNIGKRVPEDIGVVGFDDTPLAVNSQPPLTTIQVQKELMGKKAVLNVIDLIRHKEQGPVTTLLSVKLIERDSVRDNFSNSSNCELKFK